MTYGCMNLWLPPQSYKVNAVGVEAVNDGGPLLVVVGRLKRSKFPRASLDSESETSMAASTSSLPLVPSAGSLRSGEPARLFSALLIRALPLHRSHYLPNSRLCPSSPFHLSPSLCCALEHPSLLLTYSILLHFQVFCHFLFWSCLRRLWGLFPSSLGGWGKLATSARDLRISRICCDSGRSLPPPLPTPSGAVRMR